MRRKFNAYDFINTSLLIFVGIFALLPVWNIFVISITDGPTYLANRTHFWPRVINFDEYLRVLRSGDLLKGLGNTAIITSIGTVLALFVTTSASYALSRQRLRGRKIITSFILFTMFFSAGMIPFYLTVTGLGLKNTYWAIILPMSVSAYFMIIMRTYLGNISVALEESAKIDGASDFNIFFQIFVPVSKPMLAAIGLFYFVNYYNDFMNALLFITKRSMYPLQYLLREVVINNISSHAGVGGSTTATADIFRMASVMISLVPILAIYPFLQKYFIQGLMLGSIKE